MINMTPDERAIHEILLPYIGSLTGSWPGTLPIARRILAALVPAQDEQTDDRAGVPTL